MSTIFGYDEKLFEVQIVVPNRVGLFVLCPNDMDVQWLLEKFCFQKTHEGTNLLSFNFFQKMRHKNQKSRFLSCSKFISSKNAINGKK